MKRLCANYNKTEDVHILDKKVDLYQKLKPFFKRDIVSVTSDRDKEEFINFCAKHNTCMKKPEASGCGRGIEIIKDITEDLFEKLRDERVVLEEIVHSHEEIRKFNATSLNTVRVITFLTDSGCIPYRAYF